MTTRRGSTPRTAATRRTAAPLAVGPPRWAWIPAALGAALLILPLLSLLVRADWARIPAALGSDAARQALWLSLRCGVAATVVCLVLGTPLAVVMARNDGALTRGLRTLVTIPLVLPPMVGGIALIYLLSSTGLAGQYLFVWLDVRIAYTTLAVVIAETFVALPFLVLTLEGALRTAGTRFEAVAATLGADPWTVLRRVTLPLVAPALASATALCFARALGEFGATALFAGSKQGVTRTLPLAIYAEFNGGGDGTDVAVAMSLLLVVVAVAILLLIRPRRTPV